MSDQYKIQDPSSQFTKAGPEFEQKQEEPGLQTEMTPIPDCGEKSYRGTGRLKGRKALVTGADSGIGRAAAIAFAREGADVVLTYLPEEEADARQVVEIIEEEGRKAVAIPGDLKDEAFCVELVEKTVKELGGLDILANVAGKQQFVESIADLTSEQFDATFKTNVYSLFWICKAALKHMKPGGSIINTSSIQAYSPSPILLDYATTKAAINTFSKALAQQVGEQGIRVNVVAPGPVWTPLQVAGGQPTEKLKEFGNTTPLGRPGQPVEMAPAFVYLASQESSYVSGETLNANGGMPTP